MNQVYHSDDWNLLQTADSIRTVRTIVPPLLTTRWGQGSSNDNYEANAYNYFAPQLCGNDNCAAGCAFNGSIAGMCANITDLLRAMANNESYETDWLYN